MKAQQCLVATTALAVSVFVLQLDAARAAVAYKATVLHPISGIEQSTAEDVSANTQVGLGVGTATGGISHALLWRGIPASVVDLHPAGYTATRGAGAWDEYQVGQGTIQQGIFSYIRALLWNGTPDSVVDLHPTNPSFSLFKNSQALAIHGNTQVGELWGDHSDTRRAVMWHGSAVSAINLHPTGYRNSIALDTFMNFQVGEGDGRALLWNGSAASVVVLHPSGYERSRAEGISATGQVGYGHINFQDHALLWRGTAASVIDLHPTGFSESRAYGANDSIQVGMARGNATGGKPHAFVWSGSSDSAVDLHAALTRLPITFLESNAYDADNNGTIVGYGFDGNTSYAILWTPVPEPCTLLLAACGMAAITAFISRQHRKSIEVNDP